MLALYLTTFAFWCKESRKFINSAPFGSLNCSHALHRGGFFCVVGGVCGLPCNDTTICTKKMVVTPYNIVEKQHV